MFLLQLNKSKRSQAWALNFKKIFAKASFSTKACLVVASLYSFQASAHDFWLLPSQFQIAEPTAVPIKFRVGHKQEENAWGLAWKRVVAIRNYHSMGVTDLSASLIPQNNLTEGMVKASLSDKGSHIIGFESYHSTSVLEAEKFNDYAKTEGLDLILATRERRGESDSPGREIYSRKAKTIIQVGDKLTSNATQAIGHTLEIVPVNHPYALTENGTIKVQVLLQGRPLANAQIELASLVNFEREEQQLRTDKNGMAEFNIEPTGSWMFNVIYGLPIRNDSRAEFETYFASLSIGY